MIALLILVNTILNYIRLNGGVYQVTRLDIVDIPQVTPHRCIIKPVKELTATGFLLFLIGCLFTPYVLTELILHLHSRWRFAPDSELWHEQSIVLTKRGMQNSYNKLCKVSDHGLACYRVYERVLNSTNSYTTVRVYKDMVCVTRIEEMLEITRRSSFIAPLTCWRKHLLKNRGSLTKAVDTALLDDQTYRLL